MTVTVKDQRRLPFFMVTKAAMAAIREHFDSRRGPAAIGVYVTLVELANDARKDGESFTKPRREIATRAMMNVRALDRYVTELVEIGLLSVEHIRLGGVHRPNLWRLTDPPQTAGGVVHLNDTTLVPSNDTTVVHSNDTRVVSLNDTVTTQEEDKKRKNTRRA